MAYKLSNKANDDLIHIFVEGVRLFGLSQAEEYHAGLERSFAILAANPAMARERTEITPTVRVHPHGSHVIVYVIDDHQDVLVIRVRHHSEDWMGDPRNGY